MGEDLTKNGRVWIYPKLIKGKLYQYRNWLSYALLALMFSGPFIKVNGEQLMLFNILERKFVIFGVVFWPQDFHIFALAMLTFIIFIILFHRGIWKGLVRMGLSSNYFYGNAFP